MRDEQWGSGRGGGGGGGGGGGAGGGGPQNRDTETLSKRPILVFETGDELAKGLLEFAEQEKLSAASFKAVGALSSVRLGWFSWESKQYEPSVTLDEQVELLSLIGDIAVKGEKPVVHAHAVIGRKDGTAHARAAIYSRRIFVRPVKSFWWRARSTFKNKLIRNLVWR